MEVMLLPEKNTRLCERNSVASPNATFRRAGVVSQSLNRSQNAGLVRTRASPSTLLRKGRQMHAVLACFWVKRELLVGVELLLRD